MMSDMQIFQQKEVQVCDAGVFEVFYLGWLRKLTDRLSKECGKRGLDMPQLDSALVKAIVGQFQKISLRSLLVEMQLCHELKELSGGTDRELYADFAENKLQDEQFLQELYDLYPELLQGMLQVIEDNVNNLLFLLSAFEQDKEEVNQTMFADDPCEKIVRIGGGDSDSHQGGKKVYWLLLDNGKRLVFKPRSLKIDKLFHSFVRWVSEEVGYAYWWNQVLDKGEYGWCEWVQGQPCQDNEQLKQYYRRNGILLCVSYLLGSEDMHYENLIACGEYPILVDLEMGLGSRGIKTLEQECSEVERLYQESVLHTGILPLFAWNENGEGVNVGALNGAGGQLAPIRIPVVAQAGTVHMHIEYRKLKMSEGKNLATLNGEFIEPYEFVEEIMDGFRRAYQVISENREAVRGKLKQFRGVQVRYLVRETQQYAMMINGSYMPQYMMDGEERKRFLREMNRSEEALNDREAWSCQQEEAEMYLGDVPYFWYDAWDTALHSGTGEGCEDYFPVPVIACIDRRLSGMGDADLIRQQKFIRNSLMIGSKSKQDPTESDDQTGGEGEAIAHAQEGLAQSEEGLRVAEKIGDLLLDEAIWSEDGTSVGWISMIMAGYQERGCLIRPMGYYLYDGIAGVAVFFAELAKRSGQKRFIDVAKTLILQLFQYTDKLDKQENLSGLPTGAFCGEASLAYTYLLLYELSGENVFSEYLSKQCRITARYLATDQNYDVIGGNAGALLVFLNAYEMTGEKQYLDWAKTAGDEMLRTATAYEWGIGWVNSIAGIALTGFAHGASGMVYALAKLGYCTGEEKYNEAAYQAYRYEQHYFMPEIGDWKDLREGEADAESAGYDLAWCHGRGGILAAYRMAEPYAVGELKTCLMDTLVNVKLIGEGEKEKRAMCLCHGQMGNLGLYELSECEETTRKGHVEIIHRLVIRNKEEIRSMLEMQERENFGFMSGISGIGYGCVVGTKKVADILMIERK